jgi:hypothetical protein
MSFFTPTFVAYFCQVTSRGWFNAEIIRRLSRRRFPFNSLRRTEAQQASNVPIGYHPAVEAAAHRNVDQHSMNEIIGIKLSGGLGGLKLLEFLRLRPFVSLLSCLANRGGFRTFAALCTKARFAGQSTISRQFQSSFYGPSRHLSELRFFEFHYLNMIITRARVGSTSIPKSSALLLEPSRATLIRL